MSNGLISTYIPVLQQADIFTMYLPFLLVFAIFYALLTKVKLFGQGPQVNKINGIISFIIGLYVMVASPLAVPISLFFAMFFAQASVILVTLLVFVLIVGLLLGPLIATPSGWKEVWGRAVPLIVIVGFLVVVGLAFSAGGTNIFAGIAPGIGLAPEDMALIALVVVTLIVLYWLTSGKEPTRGVELRGVELLGE